MLSKSAIENMQVEEAQIQRFLGKVKCVRGKKIIVQKIRHFFHE